MYQAGEASKGKQRLRNEQNAATSDTKLKDDKDSLHHAVARNVTPRPAQ